MISLSEILILQEISNDKYSKLSGKLKLERIFSGKFILN
jgi:hypothetical protein